MGKKNRSEKYEPVAKGINSPLRIAKKDHVVCMNKFHFVIKKGDDLSAEKFKGLLENFETTLKTEKVL